MTNRGRVTKLFMGKADGELLGADSDGQPVTGDGDGVDQMVDLSRFLYRSTDNEELTAERDRAMKATGGLAFTPPRDDCPVCPADGYCNLTCVWEPEPLTWEGDQA